MLTVVDANVFVGAFLGAGAANQVLAACLRDEHTPLMGTALLMEYEDVLGRAELFAKSRLSVTERNELFDIFLAHCRWTRIYFGWRPNLPDEAENDEMATLMLAEFNAETRFLMRAKRGRARTARGLELLRRALACIETGLSTAQLRHTRSRFVTDHRQRPGSTHPAVRRSARGPLRFGAPEPYFHIRGSNRNGSGRPARIRRKSG